MANVDGWQYLSRVVVMTELGRLLRSDEHVDHKDQDMHNNDVRNLRLLLDTEHGKYHHHSPGSYAVLGEWVEERRKFVEYSQPKEM